MESDQTIEVPLKVGSRVSVLKDIDLEIDGYMATPVFEDTVVQYIPQTGKLVFDESDIGLPEFKELLEEYDSVEIVRE